MNIGIMMRHSWELGGINVYTKNIVGRLLDIANGHKFSLFYATPVVCGQYKDRACAREILIRSDNRFLWDQLLILPYLNNGKIDLVFNPKLSLPLGAACRSVFTLHGMEQFAARRLFKSWDRLYYSVSMPLYCRKATAILVMTETGKRDARKYLGIAERKLHVIPESYNESCTVVQDQDILGRIRTKYALPAKFLLFVGGITPLKNLPVLLKAFSQLKREGFEHKLVLAGFKRWKYERDLALIKDLGIDQDVLEIGFVDDQDVAGVYNLADCFVLPSFYEGFGIPILEAQASGCPVVCSSGGAMPEVAGDGALIFDPYRVEDLAEKIRAVLRNGALRSRLVQAGLDNVRRFSWAETARKTLELFEELTQREKTSPAYSADPDKSRTADLPALAH